MKTKEIIITLAILLGSLSIKAQNHSANDSLTVKTQKYTIKGQINANIYASTMHTWMEYYIDASYGVGKQLNLGLHFGTDYLDNFNNYIYGLDVRYYLTPFILKESKKVDFYTKASGSYILNKSKINNYTATGYSYRIFIGVKYMPFKYLGLMAEVGYGNFREFKANLGLSFRINNK